MAYQEQHYQAGLAAGREISPAPLQGGSKLIFTESDVVGPNDPVEKGDPCLVGSIPGVVVLAPEGEGDKCIVQTSGVWSLTVTAQDDQGNANITIGAPLYIASGVVSIDDTGALFGYALNTKTGSATPSTICVKLATA